MRKFSLLAVSMLLAVSPAIRSQDKGDVVSLDPAFNEIASSDAKVEKLAGGLMATNGPFWLTKQGFLLFSDPPANIMYKWDPREGKHSVYMDKSGLTRGEAEGRRELGSNGTTMDRQGRLVFVAQGDREIVRIEADGKRTTLFGAYEGKPLDSPNDLVYKSDGSVCHGSSRGSRDPLQGWRGAGCDHHDGAPERTRFFA